MIIPPLYERDYCVNGHEVTKTSVRGYPRNGDMNRLVWYCIPCTREKQNERRRQVRADKSISDSGRAAVGYRRHRISFVCNHENIFTDPVPSIDDVLYCYRCEDYSTVVNVEWIMRGQHAGEHQDS